MAEAAVINLLANIAPFFREEVNLLSGVREEIEYIRDEFERMTAFLRVADAREESDPQLKVWVKQVRDAAHDTEDVLDKFKLHLAQRRAHGFFDFLCKTTRFVSNLKARHQMVSEVRRIKSRVVNISEGHQRYHTIYGTIEQASTRPTIVTNDWHDCRGDALLLEEAEVVGIEKPRKQLIGWLVEGSTGLNAVSVVGMGGSGKTTLVKKVYDDGTVKKHFKTHAWLTVSESFRVEDLLKDMIGQLFGEIMQPVPFGVETMNNNRLKGIVKDFLRQRRYLVVFDDVWNISTWEAIKYILPDNDCGSRVIITTRFAHLASTCCQEIDGNIHSLMPLSAEDSWTLFCKKTFRGNLCPPHLEKISVRILKRCEGLPLAIVAISGVLAAKDRSRIDEWEMLYRSLGAELDGNGKLESMKQVLSLSYNDLPYYLKICFLYLSVFPEDHQIERMRIIRFWMAEGFVNVTEGKTLEEVAEGYLSELVNRNLVQVARTTSDGRLRSCRIHDLMREIILVKAKEQNIATIVCGGDTRWPEKVRRLSIHRDSESVANSKHFSRLRSLIVFGAEDLVRISSLGGLCRGGSRHLKLLDLRGTPLETLPGEIFKLIHLKYLSLRSTPIQTIPKLIGKLENLETLDLKGTYVTELPDEILRLKKLRHLLLNHYEYGGPYPQFSGIRGFKAPCGIGSLQSLQKLSLIEADEINGNGISIVKELGRLTELRRLCIAKLRRDDGTALCSSIGKLNNLRSLNIASLEEDEILDLQSLFSAPPLLQRLYLKGRLEKLPHWITSHHSLFKVYLKWSKLRVDPLQSLQDLPNLIELQLLQEAYEGEGLCFKAGRFKRLKVLGLQRLNGLRWVKMEEGTMPRLERLYIRDCELVEEIPSGIEHITTLNLLVLGDMSGSLVSKLDPQVQDGDNWKISHIPEVTVMDSTYGYWRAKHL
ncbi:Disease resistance protein [Actinidia chinensis var. chinensis]|uniref:Disease resistance protein n=1 Tax=Actinidia chinensis var. chinensis TaxID=1590841 RepID=A0A2R6Q3A9_ACTCC|nr:Disease resistance protein [Actinidia chinensis var. chinensis]